MSEVTVKEKVDTRVHESDLPPRVYTPIPEDYRPALTRTYATPSYVTHVAPPPEPPLVPARLAHLDEVPTAALNVFDGLRNGGWRTAVTFDTDHAGNNHVAIFAKRGRQLAMTSWTVTVDAATGELKGTGRENHLWPHGVGTSMLGATEWANALGIKIPRPRKKKAPKAEEDASLLP